MSDKTALLTCLSAGALLGAIIGGLVAGKKGVLPGAIIGLPWLLCPLLVAGRHVAEEEVLVDPRFMG